MLNLLIALTAAWLTVGEPNPAEQITAAGNHGNLRKPAESNVHATSCQTREFDSSLGADGGENMAQCQGDCDGDDDCADGLMCKQRDRGEAVPGCSGGVSWPQMDYCYDPQCEIDGPGLPSLDSSYGKDGGTNMPKCAGDCDRDEHCAGGLRCFQRDGVTTVPGCTGTGIPNFDYCYDPADAPEPPTQPPGRGPNCLCVFDIDRTLTGKQGTASNECPADKEIPGIWDTAYRGGWLTISQAGQNLQNTFCGKCYMGIVSHGVASGPNSRERTYLLENVLVGEPFQALLRSNAQAAEWGFRTVRSPLVLGWPDKEKQDAVAGIVAWYEQQGIRVRDQDVYFFGDRTENIPPFSSTAFNAREISCGSRDMSIGNGMVGLCGAATDEIVDTKGVVVCADPKPLPTPTPPPSQEDCLCIFDIDRTLTGKQGDVKNCPDNRIENTIWDTAYGGGWLTLSDAAQKLSETFCNFCYLGLISAGDAGGRNSPQRPYLLDKVLISEKFSKLRAANGEASAWSDYPRVDSPLVLKWPNLQKQNAAEDIVAWYAQQGVTIPPSKVHFYGDRTENIGPFADKGYNAREISCGSRDYSLYSNGMVGYCGAKASEIVDTPGVAGC